jgi:hypothetical protein
MRPHPTGRLTRLIGGVSVLLIFGYGTVVGTAPTVIAPVTGFVPYPAQTPVEGRYDPQNIIPAPTATPSPSPTLRPSTRPTPRTLASNGNLVVGVASWFCMAGVSRCTKGYPPGSFVAAINRRLLNHRGDYARVCLMGSSKCVIVKIVDCNCGKGANLIDLYATPFSRLASTSRGRINVTLRWLK